MRNRDAIIQFNNSDDSPLRATGLPIAPATQIVNEIMQCRRLFVPRSERYSQHWSSVDMILDSQWTPESRRCPAFVAWVEQCVPWLPNRAYIARLQPHGVIERQALGGRVGRRLCRRGGRRNERNQPGRQERTCHRVLASFLRLAF